MKKPPYNQSSAIRGALRRAFSRSPVVREVMMKVRREVAKFNKDGTRSKKDAVQYRCSPCGEWVSSTKCAVDHITPVIDVQTGFVDWSEFVARLFCGPDNLQVICDTCHSAKTQAERIARLTVQYNEELNIVEHNVGTHIGWHTQPTLPVINETPKETLKKLNRYIAKKKTKGLEQIVERAQALKDKLVGKGKNNV